MGWNEGLFGGFAHPRGGGFELVGQALLVGIGGRPRCLDASARALLVARVGQQPGATLAELQGLLAAGGGQRVCLGGSGGCWTRPACGAKKALQAIERDTSRVVVLRGLH